MRHSMIKWIVHHIMPTKKAQYKALKRFAREIKDKNILEIGSGKGYKVEKFFDNSNTFTKSDINPSFGHRVLDVTRIESFEEYDVIICLNVLEHVFDYNKAIKNMHNALKKGGTLFIGIPAFYPLHDIPHDYWRFTEFSLNRLFKIFSLVEIERAGMKAFPYNYNVICRK